MSKIRSVLETLQEKGAEYCDVRRETVKETFLELKNGEKEKAIAGTDSGYMIRVLYEDGWSAVSVSEKALKLAKKNNEVREEKSGVSIQDPTTEITEIGMDESFLEIGMEEKMEYLQDLEKQLKQDHVRSTELGYSDALVKKEIYTGEGTEIEMKIPRVMARFQITGKSDTLQTVSESVGDTSGYEITKDAYKKTERLLERLETLLEADSPPSGRMPIIMDPELAGIFVHEAFGHAAEGDLVASGDSCLENKLGENVASENVTIVDDPTMDGYGKFPYDDEGTKAEKRVLVKNGELNNYILDKKSSWKLDMDPNGGARAESYRNKPLVRMSNTIMKKGDMKLEELLEQIDHGIYAKSSRGGQVDPSQGTFQFNAEIAELIENGERKGPVRDVSFNGFTLETLKNVVGMTEEVDYSGVGACGKDGQRAPVGSGGPNVLISEATVGGKA